VKVVGLRPEPPGVVIAILPVTAPTVAKVASLIAIVIEYSSFF
jgi:hypothetical protein